MNKLLKQWRESGKYLPDILRDFHDQKDAFKMLHDTVAVDKHEYAKDISWVQGHCYIIDCFLWFMAKYGYTLQKSRAKIPFENFDEAVDAWVNNRRSNIGAIIKSIHEQAVE